MSSPKEASAVFKCPSRTDAIDRKRDLQRDGNDCWNARVFGHDVKRNSAAAVIADGS